MSNRDDFLIVYINYPKKVVFLNYSSSLNERISIIIFIINFYANVFVCIPPTFSFSHRNQFSKSTNSIKEGWQNTFPQAVHHGVFLTFLVNYMVMLKLSKLHIISKRDIFHRNNLFTFSVNVTVYPIFLNDRSIVIQYSDLIEAFFE